MPNTTILSAAVNQNFTDIATGLSDCLTRDGQAGMSAAFKAISGSLGAPGVAFTSDPTAGLYLNTTGVLGLVVKSLGLLVNSSVFQVSSAAVQAGGSGYAVGDTITLTGGTAISQAVLTVATLSGSAVATVTVTYPGNYTTKPTDPVAQGSTSGAGTGATFNITWTTQFTRSAITTEAGALPWVRLGSSSYISGIMAKANAFDFAKSILTFGSGTSLSNATSPPTLTTTLSPTLVPNYISGLILSTAGSSTTMSISAGVANDSTNTVLMNLASAISKTTASWAVGTGNGGIDTGAIANTTFYHFYEIERVDTGVVDVIFSLSASAPTLPTNYTIYRRIGAGKTNASAQWVSFSQVGNEFLLNTTIQDFTASNVSTSPVTVTLGSVPTGVVMQARISGNFSNAAVSNLLISSLDVASAAVNTPAGNTTVRNPVAGQSTDFQPFYVRTNTSAQIRIIANAASSTVNIVTTGWIDYRGQQ